MSQLIYDLKQLVIDSITHINSAPRNEITTFLLLLGAFLFLIFIQHKAKEYVTRDKVFSFYEFFLVDLVLPLFYILFVGYSSVYLKGQISHNLFVAVSYFYIGNSLIQSGFLYSDDKHYFWKVVSVALLTTGVLALFVLELNNSLTASHQIARYLSALFKLSLIFLIYILLFFNLQRIVEKIPEKFRLSGLFLSTVVKIFTPLYFLISILWLIKIINFSDSFFIGFIVSLIGIAVYAISRFYIRSFLGPRISLGDSSYQGLLKNINYLFSIILILFLYLVFKGFFNLGMIVEFLRNTIMLNTDIIQVSVYAVLASIYIFLLLLTVLNIVKHAVYFFYTKRGMTIEAESVRQLVFNLGLLLVAVIFLSKLGFTWKALLPIAGALGIGIGIGLQNIMNNYVSGFILLFSRKLKMGDIVELDGNAGKAAGNTLETVYGRVSQINLLSTLVKTTDGIEIIVPNSHFIEQKIVNYSLTDQFIRLRIPFGVSYESDPDTIKEILLDLAKDNKSVLDSPAPVVWFDEMADSALVFDLLVWVDIRSLWKINPLISDIYFKGWYKLKEAGIVIPFPQRDVWFKNKVQLELPDEIVDKFRKNEKE